MKRPNVVMIVVDSLRADHLGCYGYHRDTSPHLDALAAESTRFTQMLAPGIPTTPAFTTLFTGLHPYRHGVLSHGGDMLLDSKVLTLPQAAQQAGYKTVGIDNLVVQGNGRGSWFARGFDFYSAFSYQPFGQQSTQLVDRTLRFLDECKNEDFLLFLHLWDPHSPYAPPPPFDTMHYDGASTPPQHLQEIKSLAPQYYESFLGDMKFEKPDDFDWIMAQYDGEVSYADQQIGRILDHVRVLNLWDETIVVVMSDHGECFGEGGFWFDHHGLYDANLRVASIWRVPGQEAKQCDDFVSTQSVFATLSELCGWPAGDEYSVGAPSFAPALRGESSCSLEGFVAVECSRQASLAWRTPRWKLIVPIAKNSHGETVPDFYGDARDDKVLLFDLENDSAELCDVAGEFLQVRDDLLAKLNAWREIEKEKNGRRDLILETPLGLPFEEFMERLAKRK